MVSGVFPRESLITWYLGTVQRGRREQTVLLAVHLNEAQAEESRQTEYISVSPGVAE